jgi:flagellar hook-associated protein 3 FlgL
MTMRISTSLIFERNTAALFAKQERLSRLQQELATGRRILTPADDPGGAQRAMRLAASLGRLAIFTQNMQMGQMRLKQEDTVLQAVRGVLDMARNAGMGVQSQTDMALRNKVADHLTQLRADLLAYANSQDANGDYLFAGAKAGSAPFQLSGGTVNYQGDAFQLEVAISENRQIAVSDPGDAVFSMGTANDPFAAIQQLVTDLQDTTLTGSAYATAIGNGVAKLAAALDRVDTIRNSVANRLGEISSAMTVAANLRLQSENELQKVESADTQKVAVELQLQQISLQASQQAFANASQLSLFNYL